MCQARVSLHFHSVLVWTILGSLTFGFCSIWTLHFVAMLAYELDVQIGVNVPLTVLSSILAVLFTFAALASDLLWTTCTGRRHGDIQNARKRKVATGTKTREPAITQDSDSRPLLDHTEEDEAGSPLMYNSEMSNIQHQGETREADYFAGTNGQGNLRTTSPDPFGSDQAQDMHLRGESPAGTPNSKQPPNTIVAVHPESTGAESSEPSTSRRSSSFTGSSSTVSHGFSSIMNIAYRTASPGKNAFIATGDALYHGCTTKNAARGFLWSLAITSMHYSGIFALRVPDGHCTLDYGLVVLSGIMSWLVCVIGCILMPEMETHLSQQFLFSAVATLGVAAMHFTGNPSQRRNFEVIYLTPARHASCHLLV